MRIAYIVGTRPNFIKLAPVFKELKESFQGAIIHTGQHYDYEMDKVFFDELDLPKPDYHLGVRRGSHGWQVGAMLQRIENVLVKEKPDLVLVFGDTNSTLAGALAAVKLGIKVGHVEAGLRSFDKAMPEEINRVLVDHCSSLLFCPTKTAVKNLKREGIVKGVYLTGDVMVEVLKENLNIAETKSKILNELKLKPKDYLLVTVHRAENVDNSVKLKNIVEALCEIDSIIVFPCHPRTERRLKEFKLWRKLAKHIKVIKPVGYWDMLILEKNAKKILTDSGGVQKEAYLLKVPCITLRENTEWIETVKEGWNVLVGTNKEKIIKAAYEFTSKHKQRNIFGSGKASKRIKEVLDKNLAFIIKI